HQLQEVLGFEPEQLRGGCTIAVSGRQRLQQQLLSGHLESVPIRLDTLRRRRTPRDDPARHVLQGNGWARAEHNGTPDDVRQLSDVAGPIIGLECSERFVSYCRYVPPDRLRMLPEKISTERPYVFSALSQRRQLNRDDVEPVVEIFTEPPFLHGIF